MKKNLILVLMSLLFFVGAAHADATTHALGDTGYMIREAMQAKAYKYDKQNYRQAIKLQSEAKKYLRGTHKKGRSPAKAVELSREAYVLAKQSRDVALAAQGLKVAW